MFTGIIQAIGKISSLEKTGNDIRLTVNAGKLELTSAKLGDSIAVNGVCLTVVDLGKSEFVADVSGETLSKTTLGEWKVGSKVNLETALTLSTPLGGHLVSGHVDGVGQVTKRWRDGKSERFEIEVPLSLARYIAKKGSVCVDGVSLTVNDVSKQCFELNIVPHTLKETIFDDYKVGQRLNIEVDLIARYVERMLSVDQEDSSTKLNSAFLQEHGFLR